MEVSSHVSYKTLKVYLSGIRLEHLEQGFRDPTDDEVLHLICRGIRRLLGDNNCRTRCPITINLLRILKTRLTRSAAYTILEQRLLWAAFALAFYEFMRVSEFTAPSSSDSFSPPGLHWSDVQLHQSSVALTLCQSKTDPFRRGHCITVSATNTSTCLVRALHRYCTLVHSTNRVGPLFNGGRFAPLSRVHITSVVRQLLQGTGVNQAHYSSHSFRIGAATTAAAAGLPASLIKTLGRWKSNAYESYVQFPPSSLLAVSSILARTDADTQPMWNTDDSTAA